MKAQTHVRSDCNSPSTAGDGRVRVIVFSLHLHFELFCDEQVQIDVLFLAIPLFGFFEKTAFGFSTW
jgi:hypothetical protein